MSRRAPLSPSQYASFAMARVLILYSVWDKQSQEPFDTERAMLLDFASQHPRAFVHLVPELRRVLRAHDMARNDLTDLFAFRRFGILREQFLSVVSDLFSRDLMTESQQSLTGSVPSFSLTSRGVNTAALFTSALSFGYRAIDSVLCDVWQRKNVLELSSLIRLALPQEAALIADLSDALPEWIGEEI